MEPIINNLQQQKALGTPHPKTILMLFFFQQKSTSKIKQGNYNPLIIIYALVKIVRPFNNLLIKNKNSLMGTF